MPQFRVLESSGGITVDALVTVDANSHQFTPAEQAHVSQLHDPRSTAGSNARGEARRLLVHLCDNIANTISDTEASASNMRRHRQIEEIRQAASEAADIARTEMEKQIAAANTRAEEVAAANLRDLENAVAASKLVGAASRDDEVTKLSNTVLALEKELRQLKADAEFQQAADEARRVAQNQARRARRAKAAAAAKAKPTSKRK